MSEPECPICGKTHCEHFAAIIEKFGDPLDAEHERSAAAQAPAADAEAGDLSELLENAKWYTEKSGRRSGELWILNTCRALLAEHARAESAQAELTAALARNERLRRRMSGCVAC